MKYRPCEQVDWKPFDAESVLLNLATGYYFRLNQVGSYIWSLLDGQHHLGEIIDRVVTRFRVSQRQARRDVQSFIGQLLAEKLIRKA